MWRGNHEIKSGVSTTVKALFKEWGVNVLEGNCENIVIRNDTIDICGIDDMAIGKDIWSKQISSCNKSLKTHTYSVLLSHRPDLIDEYRKRDFDLVLCGHTHGGQVRIPKILNGLYAPNQGFLPKYVGGEYKFRTLRMIVGRGLSKKIWPRVFNPPEIVVVDVTCQK